MSIINKIYRNFKQTKHVQNIICKLHHVNSMTQNSTLDRELCLKCSCALNSFLVFMTLLSVFLSLHKFWYRCYFDVPRSLHIQDIFCRYCKSSYILATTKDKIFLSFLHTNMYIYILLNLFSSWIELKYYSLDVKQ